MWETTFFIDNYKYGIFLHCFTGSPALAQIRYDNLARTIFFSLWNGVPRIWNSNGSCVFAYQTGKLLESYHQNTAAFVSVHVFIQDQRDRTHDAYSTVICLFSYLPTSVYRTELSTPQKTVTTLWILTCKHISREIEHSLISDFGDYQYIPKLT